MGDADGLVFGIIVFRFVQSHFITMWSRSDFRVLSFSYIQENTANLHPDSYFYNARF